MIRGADVFFGLSAPGVITTDDLKNMAKDPILPVDDEARGLDVIQPFEIGVAAEFHAHVDQPVTGQR